jgi:hypothetical protein
MLTTVFRSSITLIAGPGRQLTDTEEEGPTTFASASPIFTENGDDQPGLSGRRDHRRLWGFRALIVLVEPRDDLGNKIFEACCGHTNDRALDVVPGFHRFVCLAIGSGVRLRSRRKGGPASPGAT